MSSAYTVRKHRARIACRWKISEEVLRTFQSNHAEPYRTTFKHVSTHRNLQNRLLLYFLDEEDELNENLQGIPPGRAVIGFELFDMGQTQFDADLQFSVESAGFKEERNTTFSNDLKKVELVELCNIADIFVPENGYIKNGEMVITVEGYVYNTVQYPPNIMHHEKYVRLWFDGFEKTSEIHVQKQIIFLHYDVILRMFKFPRKQEKIKGQSDVIEFPAGFSKELTELIIKYHYHHSLVSNEELTDLLGIHRFIVEYGKMENLIDLEEIICRRLNESTVVEILNYSRGLPPPNPAIFEPHNINNLYEQSMRCLRRAVRQQKPVADFKKLAEDNLHEMVLHMITKDFRNNNNDEMAAKN